MAHLQHTGVVALPHTLPLLPHKGAVDQPLTLPLLSHMGAMSPPPTLSLPPQLGALAHFQWHNQYPQLCRYIMHRQTPPPSLPHLTSTWGPICLSWLILTCMICLKSQMTPFAINLSGHPCQPSCHQTFPSLKAK